MLTTHTRLRPSMALIAITVALTMSASAIDAPVWNPTDAELTLEVHNLLSRNRNLDVNDVEIVTEDGVVTLSGLVGNSFARHQTGMVVGEVKGVRRVVNRLDVRGTPKTDEQLVSDVIWLLEHDPATSELAIDVHAADGAVVLSGEVGSQQQKELARLVASEVYGVRRIDNQLSVSRKVASADLTTEAITKQILRRLAVTPTIDPRKLVITVDGGRAILSGAVGSVAERDLIQDLAWVHGVTEVDASELLVSPELERVWVADASLTDDLLAEDIRVAYTYDPRVSEFDITVSVQNGVAILTGAVDNLLAKHAAAHLARNVRGIHRVKNLLQVRGEITVASEEAAQNIERFFALDPVLAAEDISVTVAGDKAILIGHVNTPFKRQRAIDLAARQRGITHIENRITVADWAWKPDADLLADIRDELRWSPYVDVNDVTVSVEDGIATLAGVVDSWTEHEAAIENAYEGGARRVISKLSVAQEPQEQATYYGPSYDRFRSSRRY